MKKTTYLITLGLVMMPIILLAQDRFVEYPTDLWLQDIINSMKGLSGMSALGIVAVFVQLLMKGFKTKFGKYAGKWRLLAVYFLTLVGGVLALKITGIGWLSAAVHANTLAAGQVLVHQIYKQFFEKKDEKKTVG